MHVTTVGQHCFAGASGDNMIFPLNIYRFLTTPKDYLLDLQKKHGDPFPLSFPGAPTIWLTGQSELVKSIFTAPVDSFKASEKNPVGPLLGTEGLIMQSGSDHLDLRKEFMPYFSKKRVQSFTGPIQEIFWDMHSSYKNEGVLHLQEFSLNAALKIILKFLFPKQSPDELKDAEKMTVEFLKSYSASFLFIPHWIPGTWNLFDQRKSELDNRFYDFYLAGVEANSEGPLSELKGLTKPEIFSHLRTFIVAGHETSATSLTWALYYIHKDPFIKNRLREELKVNNETEFIENIFQNKYLDSLVSESLRIRPPVPFVTRKIINRDFILGQKSYEVGQEIGVCISLLHQDKQTWERADDFIPERFLDKKYSPYEYAPFGGGTRRCLGAELAILEMKILISLFVKYFDCNLMDSSLPEPEVMQITIGPKRPIYLRYKKV